MEPIARRTRSSLNKKPLNFVDLPFDIRYMILKLLDTSSKCKFSRCSKQCYQDVAKFRNYVKEVKVETLNFNFVMPALQMTIKFDDMQSELTFKENTVEIFLAQHTMEYDEYYERLHRKIKIIKKFSFKEEGEHQRIVARHFGYIMKHSSNSRFDLKIYHVSETQLIIDMLKRFSQMNFPYEIVNLRILKKLRSLVMPEIPWNMDLIGRRILNMEQVFKTDEVVNLTNVISSVQQLQNLKAKKIVLKSNNFSSKDVNDYIKLFMNGEIHENVEGVQWLTMEGELNLDEVIDRFDIINKILAIRESPISCALVRTTNGYGVAVVWLTKQWVNMKFFSESAFENSKEMIYGDGIEVYLSREMHEFKLQKY